MRTKVILDTDIGNDIDDAVCLAYLLAQPRCDLLGITTVTGESVKRAELASALCKAAGRGDIPIFPGAQEPLLIAQKQEKCEQYDCLSKWPHETAFEAGRAVGFLRDTIRRYPGEIVLLTIGPLTNIGLLFGMDPELPALLKGLVMMCGVFSAQLAGVGPLEWNARGDPHATAIAYRRPVKMHRSIGLDVTCRVQLEKDEVKRRFKSPMLRPVLDYAEDWFQRHPSIIFHDPLAAVTIFNESVCLFKRGRVDVELKSDPLLGMTLWHEDPQGPHEVALQVSPEHFFESYFSVF